ADRCCRNAMLTRAGFSDDALFAHAQRQKTLAKAVIDLMRAGVIQIFALEVDLRPAPALHEACGKIERCWTARIVAKKFIQLRVKLGIALDGVIRGLQFLQRMHQRFGHELPAIAAKMTFHESPIMPTSAR